MICRRRSSLFKILLAFLAIWFTIVFFFSDNRSSDANVVLSPQMLQQPDAKAYDKNNKFKNFLIDGFKDAHEGLANVIANKKFPQVNPFDRKGDGGSNSNQEVDENEMINEIAGEHEDEVRLEQQQRQEEEKKAPTKPKVPSKKRFGGKDGEDTGFIPPPNDLGLESPGKWREIGKISCALNIESTLKFWGFINFNRLNF